MPSFLSDIWNWLTGSGDMSGGDEPPDFTDDDSQFLDDDDDDEPDDEGYDDDGNYSGRVVRDPGEYEYRALFGDMETARDYGSDIACDWVIVHESGGFAVYVNDDSDPTEPQSDDEPPEEPSDEPFEDYDIDYEGEPDYEPF